MPRDDSEGAGGEVMQRVRPDGHAALVRLHSRWGISHKDIISEALKYVVSLPDQEQEAILRPLTRDELVGRLRREGLSAKLIRDVQDELAGTTQARPSPGKTGKTGR